MKNFILVLLSISLLTSCRFIDGKRVKGNGNQTTDQRTFSSFEGVESHGSFDVTIEPGSNYSVSVEAEENLQEYIETEIKNGILKISTRSGYSLRPRNDIRIQVQAPSYNRIATFGSGNITGKGLINSSDPAEIRVAGSGNINLEINASGLDVEIAGSGNIVLAGSANDFDSRIYGSGDIKGAKMKIVEGKVKIAGSGNVEISADSALDVNIMGSGGVRYSGNAQINSRVAGSGSVTRMN